MIFLKNQNESLQTYVVLWWEEEISQRLRRIYDLVNIYFCENEKNQVDEEPMIIS